MATRVVAARVAAALELGEMEAAALEEEEVEVAAIADMVAASKAGVGWEAGA